MSEEEIKKIAKREFINNVMENLDSALIFTYIQNVEQKLQQKENIINEVREKIENTTINCEGVAEDLIDDILEILDKEKV